MTRIIDKRIQSVILIVGAALIALAALLLLMRWLAAPAAPAAAELPVTPTPTAEQVITPTAPAPFSGEEVVATVNNITVTRQTWQQAARLDAVMSKLAHQPAPTAEETLDRLVNELLVLNSNPDAPQPAAAEVQAKINQLSAAWNMPAEAIATALQQANLSQADLEARVAGLLQVEAGLSRLAARHQDMNQWLVEARASAKIGVYRALARANANQLADGAPPTATPVASPAAPIAPTPNLPVGPNPDNLAPDFSLSLLNGGTVALKELRGKPVVINFWATWCPPCRRELPALQAAFESYQGRIGFIAVDVKEDQAKVAAFVKELGLTFPVALDTDGAVSGVAYEVRGIPTTIFVDANGVVVARHVGPLDGPTIDGYLAPLLAATEVATVQKPITPTNSAVAMLTADSPPLTETTAAPVPGSRVAPDFSLPAADGSTVSLQNYKNKSNVVLVFYRGYT